MYIHHLRSDQDLGHSFSMHATSFVPAVQYDVRVAIQTDSIQVWMYIHCIIALMVHPWINSHHHHHVYMCSQPGQRCTLFKFIETWTFVDFLSIRINTSQWRYVRGGEILDLVLAAWCADGSAAVPDSGHRAWLGCIYSQSIDHVVKHL